MATTKWAYFGAFVHFVTEHIIAVLNPENSTPLTEKEAPSQKYIYTSN